MGEVILDHFPPYLCPTTRLTNLLLDDYCVLVQETEKDVIPLKGLAETALESFENLRQAGFGETVGDVKTSISAHLETCPNCNEQYGEAREGYFFMRDVMRPILLKIALQEGYPKIY